MEIIQENETFMNSQLKLAKSLIKGLTSVMFLHYLSPFLFKYKGKYDPSLGHDEQKCRNMKNQLFVKIMTVISDMEVNSHAKKVTIFGKIFMESEICSHPICQNIY